MVKTGQFSTKYKVEVDRVIALKGKYHFGKTPPGTLSTPSQARSRDN